MQILFRILLFFILLTLLSGCAGGKKPVLCHSNCIQPYGAVLGVSSQEVKAYSNCQSQCVNAESSMVDGVYTGIKWQCVEYARRWLLIHKSAVYGDVETAADIWHEVDHLTHVNTNKKIPLESYVNGSKHSPKVGDLLIYARVFYNTGHVAVITNIDFEKGVIEVGEQNYSNDLWPADYARTIQFIQNGENFWLLDGYLIGWKQIVD